MDKYRPLNNMHSCRNSVFLRRASQLLCRNFARAKYIYILKNAQEKQKLMVKALGY